MTDMSNYDFHLPLRQTILIKDVRLASHIYLQDKNRRKRTMYIFPSYDICTYVSALVYLRSELISSHRNDREEKRKNANHIVFYPVNICTWTFTLLHLAFFLYLASITSRHTRNTTWTNSTWLTWETILTINRQCTIITLFIKRKKE
jgi:hypothetical protein